MGGVVKNFLVASSNQYWRCSALILDVPPALFMRRRRTIHTPSSSLWKYSSVRKECQSHQYAPTRGVEPSGKGNFYILSSILWSLYLGGGGLSSTLWYHPCIQIEVFSTLFCNVTLAEDGLVQANSLLPIGRVGQLLTWRGLQLGLDMFCSRPTRSSFPIPAEAVYRLYHLFLLGNRVVHQERVAVPPGCSVPVGSPSVKGLFSLVAEGEGGESIL